MPEQPLQVVAGVLQIAGQVLLARRTQPAALAGHWEFPGGKVDAGETAAQALARELAEELAIEVRVGAQLLAVPGHTFDRQPMVLHAYRVHWRGGRLVPHEHDAVTLVALARLASMDLLALDRPVADCLLAGS